MTTQPTPRQIIREYNRWRRGQGEYGDLCQCPHTPEEIGAAIDALLAALESAEADRERLDWLQLYLSDFTKNIGGPTSGGPGWEFGYNAGPGYMVDGYGETLRDAIDAARKAQP